MDQSGEILPEAWLTVVGRWVSGLIPLEFVTLNRIRLVLERDYLSSIVKLEDDKEVELIFEN